MRKCKIGIVGFGTVGSGIYKILSSEVDTHPILKEIEIVKIAVKDLHKKRDIEIDNKLLSSSISLFLLRSLTAIFAISISFRIGCESTSELNIL